MNKFYIPLMKKIKGLSLLTGVLFLLCIFAFKNTDVGFLQIYSIDEYVFHGSIRHMYESLLSGNLSGLFGYGFYQYGFIYFFLNLIAAFPGIILHKTWLAIIAPRIVTGLFAIGSLYIIYQFTKLTNNKKVALLFTTFFCTLPAFWFNATWFHPDWSMTFFILGFIYFLTRDNWQFKRNFWLGVISYGLALAFKYQALTFAPLLIGYIFYDSLRQLTLVGIYQKIKIFTFSLGGLVSIFIFCNPYVLHPMGWRAFSSSFVQNMTSNATNHGSSITVTLTDKINLAIGDYYLNIIFFFIFNLAAFWLVWLFFKHKEKNIFVLLAVNYLVNVSYLFLFVNKAWQIYYLPVIVSGLLILPFYLKSVSPKRAVQYLSIAIIIQIFCYSSSYIPLLSNGRDRTSPDYITYSQSEQREMNEFILKTLTPTIKSDSVVLLSSYTPLDFETLGLNYEQVKLIFGSLTLESFDLETYLAGQRAYWGDLKTDDELASSFKPVDFIIIRKDVPYMDTNLIAGVRDIQTYTTGRAIIDGLYDGTYGYMVLGESPQVVIFSRLTE